MKMKRFSFVLLLMIVRVLRSSLVEHPDILAIALSIVAQRRRRSKNKHAKFVTCHMICHKYMIHIYIHTSCIIFYVCRECEPIYLWE